VGTHAVTCGRRAQAFSQAGNRGQSAEVTAEDGTPFMITKARLAMEWRGRISGLNGYAASSFLLTIYSHYHSLQTTLSGAGGGLLSGAYTWSSLRTRPPRQYRADTAFNDETDLKFSRGLSDFDRPQRSS